MCIRDRIGSGVIAIELAQAMQRLGVKTTVFARSRKVGSLTSPKLQKIAQDILAEELNIKFEILPEQVRKFRNKVKISYTENGHLNNLTADYVLVATGRNSYLNNLSLENINSKFADLKKLPLDLYTKQLADYPIFIIGDAHTNSPVQHEAAHEGRTTVHNCLNFPKLKNIKTLTPLGIVFSQPEMAIVGQSFQQLTQSKTEFVTGLVSYKNQGRAMVCWVKTKGLSKFISKQQPASFWEANCSLSLLNLSLIHISEPTRPY